MSRFLDEQGFLHFANGIKEIFITKEQFKEHFQSISNVDGLLYEDNKLYLTYQGKPISTPVDLVDIGNSEIYTIPEVDEDGILYFSNSCPDMDNDGILIF